MKKLLTLTLLLFASTQTFSQNYIFYLHGKIIENQGAEAVDKINSYGAYKYNDILDSLRKNKALVLSEVRAKDTDVKPYALKIKKQIDSLLKKGVEAKRVTVIGASKGALIAMYVSSYAKNKDINYVFMAACYRDETNAELNFYGNILSVYEKSDGAGTCLSLKNASTGINHYKEIEINTGLRHGFLYKPLPEWVNPALKWADGNYNQ
ncbi:alpha/beta hydrolase [Aurantibacillus circumpalustris]|uniref:alpha/beta hydrolase n=1 Tax=Aurantibacillus circumpalustris TaxID=3036359 RepID=UPI00295B2596|nr:alpha/beta hydrolase [Aurantibacillus circumpalustris]